MEFVIVTCDGQSRTVFIDQQDQGLTNQRLSVPDGLHVFDLGQPLDYEPPFQEIDIQGTGPNDPLLIEFLPLVMREMRARARKARPKPRRKPAKKRAAARKRPARRSKPPAKPKQKRPARRAARRKKK